tara:strand:- start:337 stop:525 length:189 start_codon:yes stop_codon:yes gene_type:complete
MCVFFKNELPIDHEKSLRKIVEDWSREDAETDPNWSWDDHMDHNWWGLEKLLLEQEELEIVT